MLKEIKDKDLATRNQVAKKTLGAVILVLQVVGLVFCMQTLWFHLMSCCEVVDLTTHNHVANWTLGTVIWVLQVVGLAFCMQMLWFHLRSCCEVVKGCLQD